MVNFNCGWKINFDNGKISLWSGFRSKIEWQISVVINLSCWWSMDTRQSRIKDYKHCSGYSAFPQFSNRECVNWDELVVSQIASLTQNRSEPFVDLHAMRWSLASYFRTVLPRLSNFLDSTLNRLFYCAILQMQLNLLTAFIYWLCNKNIGIEIQFWRLINYISELPSDSQ